MVTYSRFENLCQSWLLFGFIYYIISIVHKDFDYFYIYANGTDKGNLIFHDLYIKTKIRTSNA